MYTNNDMYGLHVLAPVEYPGNRVASKCHRINNGYNLKLKCNLTMDADCSTKPKGSISLLVK